MADPSATRAPTETSLPGNRRAEAFAVDDAEIPAKPGRSPQPDTPARSIAPWIVGVVAIALSPGLVWQAGAGLPFAVQVDLVAVMTVFVAAVALLLSAVLSRGFRHRIRWALGVTSAAIIALFHWPAFTEAGRVAGQALPVPMVVDILPVLLAVALLWVAVRRAGDRAFGMLTAVAGVGLIAVVVWLTAPALPPLSINVAAAAESDTPDTVVIVLDEYVRDDVLRQQFGYDNTPFLEELAARGFFVATDATSNYNSTFASLSSMLALDYTYLPGPVGTGHEAMRTALAGDALLPREFLARGYDYTYLQNAWVGSTCSAAVDHCHRNLVRDAIWTLGQLTILAPLQKQATIHPFHSISFDQLSSLGAAATSDRRDGVPRLTVAHALLPHPPFHRDPSCTLIDEPARRGFATAHSSLIEERRALYTQQLECTNRLVLSAIDDVIAADPDAVIMITGDHGSATTIPKNNTADSRPDEVVAERMHIFSAYRLPGCESSLYPSITQVNGARATVNCALGTSFAPLADRNFWVPPNFAGQTVDVAHRLGR